MNCFSQIANIEDHRRLLYLALPMILSNITVPLLGLVDTAVIGHLDHAYFLGGSTVGAMVISLVTWLCGFLRMSSTGLAAQAYGAQQHKQGMLVLLRGILVALVISSLLILVQTWYLDIALSLAGGSSQVQFYAREYADIRIWGYPAALSNLVILGWLLGQHQVKAVLWVLLLTNLLNLVLDLVFVVVLQLDVRGVALATLIAEYSGMLLGLLLIANKHKQVLGQLVAELIASLIASLGADHKTRLQAITNRVWLRGYFKLNRDILIRTLCLQICFVFITFKGAQLGDNIVATNAILMNFMLLISFGLDGIANAVEALVGEAKGAKDAAMLNKMVKLSLLWTAIFALGYSALFAIAGDFIVTLITDIPSVIATTSQYLTWVIVMPLLACWCYLFDGVYIGLMQAKVMRNSMIVASFGCFFPFWWLLESLGNHGLWAALCVFMLARGVSLAWHFKRYISQPILEQAPKG